MIWSKPSGRRAEKIPSTPGDLYSSKVLTAHLTLSGETILAASFQSRFLQWPLLSLTKVSSSSTSNERKSEKFFLISQCSVWNTNCIYYSIDATHETPRGYGRLINDDKNGNLKSKIIAIKERPYIVFFAKNDIPAGGELTFDYGGTKMQFTGSKPTKKPKILEGKQKNYFKICFKNFSQKNV